MCGAIISCGEHDIPTTEIPFRRERKLPEPNPFDLIRRDGGGDGGGTSVKSVLVKG